MIPRQFLVPTLCVGTHVGDALRRICTGRRASVLAFPRRAWEREGLRPFVFTMLSALLALWLAAGAIAAPPIQATARAARTTVHVGEPVRIAVQVQDSEEMPQIDVPTVEGMNITSTGTVEATPSVLRNTRSPATRSLPNSKLLSTLSDLSKQLKDVSNGADPQVAQQYQAMLTQRLGNLNRNDYAIVYLATPEKTGPITVPPFTVRSGGQTVKTQPFQLSVAEPRPSAWVKAVLSLSNPQPSVGDTVNLYVDLLVRRWVQQVGRGNVNLKSQPLNHVTLTVPTLEGYKEIQPLESLEQFVEKRRLPSGQLGYHINDFPGVILLEQEPQGAGNTFDPQWYRRRLTIPFRAVKAGEMEVQPLRVAGEVYVPSTGKERYTWEGFAVSSSPLEFRIREALNPPADPAPRPSRLAAENAACIDEPSAAAEPPSHGESVSEETARPWLLMLGTFAATAVASFMMIRVALVVRRLLAVRRQRIALRSRRRQAIDTARLRLRESPSTATEVSAAVQDFLRAQLEMEPGEITPEEAAECLTQAGYPAGIAQKCSEILRACAARQFAPLETTDEKSDEDLATAVECLVEEILTVKRNDPSNPPAPVDELTRARQAALAD